MLTVKRPVMVVALSTEALKTQLLAEVDAAIDQLNLQAQQLEFQHRRAVAELQSNVHRLVEARKEMDAAKEQYEEQLRQLQDQRAQIEALPDDTLVARGELETTVTLQPGDNLQDKLRPVEVIVRDDVVVEILGN
ncbi:MAG TPA: YlqD family protein [Abditibacteriaceae bacterium]|jgi:chromosome segregation ATPase